jgi:hypothetical protein
VHNEYPNKVVSRIYYNEKCNISVKDIINIIEEKGYKYIIKAKKYDTMINELYTDSKTEWVKTSDGKEMSMIVLETKLRL